ncbi:MAG: TraB/GumN family protein [Candidatus Zophobacter franzmannii]|nr:TraB/GumN family protein [Candidatus Zophobacter franzmannii]
MQKFRRYLLVVVVLAFFASNIFAAPAGENFIWKATKGENILYLVGSIHAGDMSMYPLNDVYWESLNKSDAIAVEADVYGQMEGFATADNKAGLELTGLLMSMIGKMFYSDGDSLAAHLSPKTCREVVTFFKEFDTGSSPYGSLFMGFGISKLRPGMIALIMEGMALEKANLQPELGIDYSFLKQAHHTEQPIIELEGIEEQLSIFLDMSDESAEYILNDSMNRMDDSGEEFKKLVKYWVEGNEKKILKMLNDDKSTGYEEFSEEFLYARNRTMLTRSLEAMDEYPTLFMVVGAAHIIGKGGLIEMFKEEGFKIKRM